MSTLVGSPVQDLRRLVDEGKLPDDLTLVYELGDTDNLHLWLLSSAFARVSQRKHSHVYQQLRRLLPDRILLRVTLLSLLTPEEFERVYSHRPEEFPEPADGAEDAGPFRLSRSA